MSRGKLERLPNGPQVNLFLGLTGGCKLTWWLGQWFGIPRSLRPWRRCPTDGVQLLSVQAQGAVVDMPLQSEGSDSHWDFSGIDVRLGGGVNLTRRYPASEPRIPVTGTCTVFLEIPGAAGWNVKPTMNFAGAPARIIGPRTSEVPTTPALALTSPGPHGALVASVAGPLGK